MTDLAAAAGIHYLTQENASFFRTPGGLLGVTSGGAEHQPVYLHCSFPHTAGRQWISVRTADGAEIGMIASIDDFPAETARLLEEFIRLRYYAPVITKVVRIREEFGYSYWETETTAGPCRFTVRSGGGQIKAAGAARLLITDVDGNRFVIEDVNRLSEKEYRMVEMCL